MPLFFIIAIGAGAFAVGATAVDVTSDTQNRERALQAQQVQQQQTYPSMADCLRAAAQQNLPASVCQQGS